MATPVTSNQLITPYMAAYEGLKTGISGEIKNSSNVTSRGQDIATAAWGSSLNYSTRIMTKVDMVNAGIWASEGASGYSNNLCVPFGVLNDYQLNNLWGYGGLQLNWGSSYINTNYNNYGYVDVYLYSPYYHIKTWSTYNGSYKFMLWCWNNSTSFAGVSNLYVKWENGSPTTLGDITGLGGYFRTISWDGTWAHIMSLPWFDNANISTSGAYLSLTMVGNDYDAVYSVDSSWWTPGLVDLNTTLTNRRGTNTYTLHNPVALSYNGQRVSIYIT